MSENILQILGVSKKYPIKSITNKNLKSWHGLFSYFLTKDKKQDANKSFLALDSINVSLNKGESLGIIGLNGSGKSTLLQLISGTLQPSTGSVNVKGKVAALLELGAGFNSDFTGKENIYLNASLFGMAPKEIDKNLADIISFANIGDYIDQPVRTYSTGMTVRLAFAIIANMNPNILIIDEALAVGDARFQLKCFSFLDEFKKNGGTLILVSHDLNSIARLCEKVIVLHEGKIFHQGNANDSINNYSKIISNNLNNEKSLLSSNEQNGNLYHTIKREKLKSGEYNYGGENAKIESCQLLDQNGTETTILHSGTFFSVFIKVRAFDTIFDPIYALTIKDTKGQQVYGQNSFFAKIPVPNLEKGDSCELIFRQKINLGAGIYFISIGCTRFERGELKVVHRRYDTIEFEVLNTDGSFGVANCFSEISYTTRKAPLQYKTKETLSFIIDSKEHYLQQGDTYKCDKDGNFFRDTTISSQKIIIEDIKNGDSWRKVIKKHYYDSNPWLYNIITSKKRTRFIDQFIKPKNLSVLDIGAGWGQFSVPLAKNNIVCAIEPTPERLNFIEAIAEQEGVLKNLYFLGENYLNLTFKNKFDLILSIGVLEWLPKFSSLSGSLENIQLQFLKKCKNDLSPSGFLIIGIENRIGLKYLLGAKDDHTGVSDILCYSKEIAKGKFIKAYEKKLECLTHSLSEYATMLKQAGFTSIEMYTAHPDYKLPEEIFPITHNSCSCDFNRFIREKNWVDEHDGTNGETLLNQEEICDHYNTLADLNIAHYFAPSFYIRAY